MRSATIRGPLVVSLFGFPLLPLLALAASPPAGGLADLQRAALKLNRQMQVPPASDAPVP